MEEKVLVSDYLQEVTGGKINYMNRGAGLKGEEIFYCYQRAWLTKIEVYQRYLTGKRM